LGVAAGHKTLSDHRVSARQGSTLKEFPALHEVLEAMAWIADACLALTSGSGIEELGLCINGEGFCDARFPKLSAVVNERF
jgi:hypothetical protein